LKDVSCRDLMFSIWEQDYGSSLKLFNQAWKAAVTDGLAEVISRDRPVMRESAGLIANP
jgi:hypothetical protein